MIHNAIDEKIEDVNSRIIELFKSFDDKSVNSRPPNGGWTPGQIMDHVLKFISGVVQALQAKGVVNSRPIDAYAKNIEDAFMNMEVKYDAPDFVVPAEPPHDKAKLLSKAERVFGELNKLLREVDLSLVYEDFALPGMPAMTRYEWGVFAVTHVERHIRQMSAIEKA